MEKYFNAFINLFKSILGIFAADADFNEVLQMIQDDFNSFMAEINS